MADSQDATELRRRARRRLVGAIALVVFVVIVLPIVLDREPKPVSQELTIQIPRQDASRFSSKVAPLPPDPPPAAAPAAPAAPLTGTSPAGQANTPTAGPAPATASPPGTAEKSAEKPAVARAVPEKAATKDGKAAPSATEAGAAAKGTDKPGTKDETARADTAKADPARSEPTKTDAGKPAPAKAAPSTEKTVARASDKAAEKATDKSAQKSAPVIADAKATDGGFMVPLGLFTRADNVKQVRSKAAAAGVKTFTEAESGSDRVRVRAGPFATRDAAEKAREALRSAGLDVGAVAAR